MHDDPFRLDGKPAIVVGAALGIGRAIASALAGAGAKVACLDIDEAAAGETATRIRSAGGTAMAHRCDVTSEASIADAVKAAIAAGYGVSIIPKSLIDTESRAGILKAKKINDLDVRYPVNIIYRRDKQLSKSALAFAEFLRKQTVKSDVLPLFRSGHQEKSRLVS